ncbi:MAG TPA: patatin-like phospholipase family protein [Frankiaceae bacterium]|jgi:NTE family protein|nr:patatin-like phospholipase family protein [Frankiaceae bacterium]
MNTTFFTSLRSAPADAFAKRALVLGGGGAAGNAWEIGVLAALCAAGLDVTQADLVIGTSAGSTAAAQISAATPAELLAGILAAAPVASGGGRPRPRPAVDHLATTGDIIASATDAADMRRRMGAAALETDAASGAAANAQRRDTVAARLPSPHWPQQPLLIVAVNARTGEPVGFDRESGVEMVDAVTASCAGPGAPAHRIGDERYIDGGYRRNENADLARGFGRVLVLSPLGGRTRMPLEWAFQLAAQVDELRAGGSRVEAVLPDGTSLDAFGANLMDLSTRPPAAQAGYQQGAALAEQLSEFWADVAKPLPDFIAAAIEMECAFAV